MVQFKLAKFKYRNFYYKRGSINRGLRRRLRIQVSCWQLTSNLIPNEKHEYLSITILCN